MSSHDGVIKIGDFYQLGIVLVACKEWQHRKRNSFSFKIFLTLFYPVSGRPLLLPGMGRIASSLLNLVLKIIITLEFKLQFSFCFHVLKRVWTPNFSFKKPIECGLLWSEPWCAVSNVQAQFSVSGLMWAVCLYLKTSINPHENSKLTMLFWL